MCVTLNSCNTLFTRTDAEIRPGKNFSIVPMATGTLMDRMDLEPHLARYSILQYKIISVRISVSVSGRVNKP